MNAFSDTCRLQIVLADRFKVDQLGSGCGSVGRAVASDTRDLWFESRHQQNFIYKLYNRKDENKEKEAGSGSSFKVDQFEDVRLGGFELF